MRLVVAAIGRLKDGPERELAERYRKRADQTGRRIGFRDLEVVDGAMTAAPLEFSSSGVTMAWRRRFATRLPSVSPSGLPLGRTNSLE